MTTDSRHDDSTRSPSDPDLLASVGGYQNRRRPGWYVALVVVGFGLGAILALAVGHRTPGDAPPTSSGITALPPTEPIRAGIVFSTDSTAPERTPDMIPAGIDTVYCHFRLPGVKQIEGLVTNWSHDGEPQGQISPALITGKIENGFAVGHIILRAPSPDGFANGIYEVTVRTPEDVIREGSFVVVRNPDKILGHRVPQAVGVQVTDATMCESVTEAGRPEAPKTTFTSQVEKIYLSFQFANAQPGGVVKIEWLFHQQVIPSATSEITLEAAEGWAYAWIGPNEGELIMPGTYRAVVKSIPDDEPLASAAFVVKASR